MLALAGAQCSPQFPEDWMEGPGEGEWNCLEFDGSWLGGEGGGVGIHPGSSDSGACSQTAAVSSADGGGTTGVALLFEQH